MEVPAPVVNYQCAELVGHFVEGYAYVAVDIALAVGGRVWVARLHRRGVKDHSGIEVQSFGCLVEGTAEVVQRLDCQETEGC